MAFFYVRNARGSLLQSLTFYRLRPNDDDNPISGEQNRTLAVDMAEESARSLGLVGEGGPERPAGQAA